MPEKKRGKWSQSEESTLRTEWERLLAEGHIRKTIELKISRLLNRTKPAVRDKAQRMQLPGALHTSVICARKH